MPDIEPNIWFGLGGIAFLVIVIFILVKLTRAIKPMSKQELAQHKVNQMAAGSEGAKYRALGKTARGCGCLGLIAVFIIILLVVDALFLTKGEFLKNILP